MGKRKIPPTRAGSGAGGEVHAALLNRGEKCGLKHGATLTRTKRGSSFKGSDRTLSGRKAADRSVRGGAIWAGYKARRQS
jgi:hypothetical protein